MATDHERHASGICVQAGLSRFDKWHRYRHAYLASGRLDPPAVDHCRRSKPEQVRDLAGSGPQLACERWKEGSPGALDAGRRHRGFDFVQVRPGNVDLPRTMLAQFRCRDAGTPIPSKHR